MVFRPDKKYAPLLVVFSLVFLLVGLGVGYYFGYDSGLTTKPITNFQECAAAGYPVMESFPERCMTPDGTSFVKEGVACTMEAKICPDGTSVGRVPPSCEFAPCPGE